MSPATIQDRAVMVRKVDYRDADVIATLFTREHGKVSALARSARRSRRRFGAALGLFTVSRVELRPKRGSELWTFVSADIERTFAALALDMATLTHGSYGTELVRELTAPEQPEPEVFDLLVSLYQTLQERGAVPMVLRAFELRLLDLVGLAPALQACVGCGAADVGDGVLDPERGGAVCARCAPQSRALGVRQLSEAARRLLCAAQDVATLAAAAEIEPDPGAAREARDTMLALLSRHLGRPLRSLEFASKLGAGPRPQ